MNNHKHSKPHARKSIQEKRTIVARTGFNGETLEQVLAGRRHHRDMLLARQRDPIRRAEIIRDMAEGDEKIREVFATGAAHTAMHCAITCN